jgi:hypothetical protein
LDSEKVFKAADAIEQMLKGYPYGYRSNPGTREYAERKIQVIRDNCPNADEGIITSLSNWLDELFIPKDLRKSLAQINLVTDSIRKDLNKIREKVRETIGAPDKAKG